MSKGKDFADCLKEAVRLSELRLAAQLQTRLALEARLGSSTPWLIAIVVAIVSVAHNRTDRHNVLAIFIAIIVVAIILNITSMFTPGCWGYSGEKPSSILSNVKCKKKYPWYAVFGSLFDKALRYTRQKLGSQDVTFVVEAPRLFEDENDSIEAKLYKLALRYEIDIAENEVRLKLIKSSLLIPNGVILVYIIIVIIFI